MKANELIKLLKLPASTLHKYVNDYADYLSPSGVGGAGRHREYTEQDARILKLILDMKAERTKPEDIEVTLSSLKAGDWSQLPALNDDTQSIVPTQENLVAAGRRESAMQREIEVLREMLDRAENRAEASSADRDELLERLHRAETLLELYRSGELLPKRSD